MLQSYIVLAYLFQYATSFTQSSLLWGSQKCIRTHSIIRNASFLNQASSSDNKSIDGPNVSIEYCTGCRWGLRSSWYQQELLTTFNEEMGSVTLIPSKPPSPGGTFIVTLDGKIIWDRKVDGGFPEAKQLKQRIRDKIAPSKDLGHSDNSSEKKEVDGSCEECTDITTETNSKDRISDANEHNEIHSISSNDIDISFCTGCKWMLRSAWMSQELLSTFEKELHSVTLTPCRRKEDGGKFVVSIDGKILWDRKEEGRFCEAKELKQRVRDQVDPSKNLGHSDVAKKDGDDLDTMDDDDAAEMRAFYGVL